MPGVPAREVPLGSGRTRAGAPPPRPLAQGALVPAAHRVTATAAPPELWVAEPWVELEGEPPEFGCEAESCEPLPDCPLPPDPLPPPVLPLPEPSDEPDEPEESPDEPDEPDPDDPEDPEPSEDPWSPPDDELPPDEPEDPFGAASFDGSVAEGSLEPEDVPLSSPSFEASPLPEESCFWACDDEEMSGCGFAPTPCPVVTRSMTRAEDVYKRQIGRRSRWRCSWAWPRSGSRAGSW